MMRRASRLSCGLAALLLCGQKSTTAQDKPPATALGALAESLAAAASAPERQALLNGSPALVTVDLRKALGGRAAEFQDSAAWPSPKRRTVPRCRCHRRLVTPRAKGGAERHRHRGAAPGALPRGAQLYAKALFVEQAIGDEPGQARTLSNAGQSHTAQAEYAEAVDAYQRALALEERIGDPRLTVRTLNSMALTERARGAYALALQFHSARLRLPRPSTTKRRAPVSSPTSATTTVTSGRFGRWSVLRALAETQ